jgi:hypothetical protein
MLIAYVLYSYTIAILNTIVFGCLVGTLIDIKHSLANFHKIKESQSQLPNETLGKPPVPLATEDIDTIREDSSWIFSPPNSHRQSVSLFSPTRQPVRVPPQVWVVQRNRPLLLRSLSAPLKLHSFTLRNCLRINAGSKPP